MANLSRGKQVALREQGYLIGTIPVESLPRATYYTIDRMRGHVVTMRNLPADEQWKAYTRMIWEKPSTSCKPSEYSGNISTRPMA